MELRSYASDLLEDAMILAQTKAINSFSFRDTINSLTELWAYCYERMAQIDAGFYSKTTRLTRKLTTMPPFVKNAVRVYSARDPVGYSRKPYKPAGMNDLNAPLTFHISGNDIYCWDADLKYVWVEWVPEPQLITFTKNNRDPKIIWSPTDKAYENVPAPIGEYNNRFYKMYKLLPDAGNDDTQDILEQQTYRFEHRTSREIVDRTQFIRRDGWQLVAFILDHPWCFTTYQNDFTGECESFISQGVLTDLPATKYNPFDFQGRGSDVQFIKAKYNDYTGMGVTILDRSDGVYKELGWTPDTLMVYPNRVMYNYMVSSLAQRFAALNGATIMAVEIALVQAQDEMGLWLKKNKSGWMRADNVTGPLLSDYL